VLLQSWLREEQTKLVPRNGEVYTYVFCRGSRLTVSLRREYVSENTEFSSKCEVLPSAGWEPHRFALLNGVVWFPAPAPVSVA
jgi:hypothetical protein